jgi:hypothetical protein
MQGFAMTAKLLPSEMDSARRGAEAIGLRTVTPEAGARIRDPHADDKRKPARGLFLGLALGIAIWLGLLLFAWEFFRKAL